MVVSFRPLSIVDDCNSVLIIGFRRYKYIRWVTAEIGNKKFAEVL